MRSIKSRSNLFFMMVLFMVTIGSCTDPDLFSEFTDPRDNKTYRVMNVNGTLWFAEDLRFNDDAVYSYQQGLNACPPGWSVPTMNDWVALNTYFGGYIYDGESIGDPGKAYNRMIEEFGAQEESFYWTSTPAWDDAASIRSSLFYFNSYKAAVEYGATLISFRMHCRCVNKEVPQSTLDRIQFTASGQQEVFDFYRIDHENAPGALAVFLHQKLDDNVTVNRVNFRFDLPASFINEQSPPIEAANVNFEYQISGLDPWSMTGYHAETDNFTVLITFYDGSTIRGTFSGLTFDGTTIQNGTFELKVTP
ncbi:MAG TPA: hypothetical protein VF141_04750 [Chryseolinea sp.]